MSGANNDDSSQADYELCSTLAWWTKDPNQIDRIFRSSGLIRDKWDRKWGDSTYGWNTINKALQNCQGEYTGASPQKKRPSTSKKPKPSRKQPDPAAGEAKPPKLPPQHEVADLFLRVHRWGVDPTSKTIYEYNGKVWSARDIEDLEEGICRFVKSEYPKPSFAFVQAVSKWITRLTRSKKWNPPNLIPCQNGVFDTSTNRLIPHHPDQFITWILPYDYDPTVNHEPVLSWLNETTQDPKITKVLLCYLAAILHRRTDLHRFLEVIGPPQTGKSTFTRLATALVGSENIYEGDLHRFESDRFEMVGIIDKILYLFSEEKQYVGGVSNLKKISGGDRVRVERKGKDIGDGYKPIGMALRVGEHPIQSNESAGGLIRRCLSIPFESRISDSARTKNPRFEESTLHPCLPGLLPHLLKIPSSEIERMVRDTNHHLPTLATHKIKTIIATDPLAQWMDECTLYDPTPGAKTQVGKKDNLDTLYHSYVEFCDGGGNRPIANNRFSRDLVRVANLELESLNITPLIKHERIPKKGSFIHHLTLTNEHIPNSLKSPLRIGEGSQVGGIDPGHEVTHSESKVTDPVTNFPLLRHAGNKGNKLLQLHDEKTEGAPHPPPPVNPKSQNTKGSEKSLLPLLPSPPPKEKSVTESVTESVTPTSKPQPHPPSPIQEERGIAKMMGIDNEVVRSEAPQQNTPPPVHPKKEPPPPPTIYFENTLQDVKCDYREKHSKDGHHFRREDTGGVQCSMCEEIPITINMVGKVVYLPSK